MTADPCPTGALYSERESQCPFRTEIGKMGLRIDRVENDAEKALHAIVGNAKPPLLDQAKAHTDAKAREVEAHIDRLSEHFEKRFDEMTKQVGNLKVWLGMLAASGGAIGSVIAQALAGGG